MRRSKIVLFFLAVLLLLNLSGCNSTGSAVRIGFNNEIDVKNLDGKEVMVRGYLATLSPVTGEFAYLMNLPYQACPFCLPQTTTITNTIVIMAKKGEWFSFYDGPVEVKGKLETGNFTDSFGYSYSFRLVDAEYSKIAVDEMSQNLKMYGSLVQDGIILDLKNLMDKALNDIQFIGSILTESSVKAIEFDDIVKRIEAISKTEYAELIAIVRNYQIANSSLGESGTDIEVVVSKMNACYLEFLSWMNKFEI